MNFFWNISDVVLFMTNDLYNYDNNNKKHTKGGPDQIGHENPTHNFQTRNK